MSLEQSAEACALAIQKSKKIVLLSGAGSSTAAGIADFRGPHGLYKTANITNPEQIFDITTFRRDPSIFYSFHRAFLAALDGVQPTTAHRFFAALEKTGKMAGIITQNIDSLHQKAGSEKVYEIHGGVWDTHCTGCSKAYSFEVTARKTKEDDVPQCDDCKGVLKPEVVFFGESVKYLYECQRLAEEADLFFVVGSSMVVTPAAMLPMMSSAEIIVVNKGEFSNAYLPSERISIYADEDIDTFFTAVDKHLDLLD